MLEKAQALHKIQRNYRIQPSQELQNFWETVEKNKLYEAHQAFHYYKIKYFKLEQVAEYDFKRIRFWFKNRGEHYLVRYYIPLGQTFALSSTTFAAAYDINKNFLGVFLVNKRIDPIFLTAHLSDLLENNEPELSKEEFIKEQISEGVRMELDFENEYRELDENGDYRERTPEERKAHFNDKLEEVLKFLELVYNVLFPNFQFKYKNLKNSFKIHFVASDLNKKWKIVKPEIEIPKYEPGLDFYNIILPILNRVNFQLWSENPDNKNEYGFYRLKEGIAMLHHHQVCEFLRLGLVPHHSNAHFPSIVFSTKPSGFVNALEYEVKFFQTQEEYSAYYKQFQIDKRVLSVRHLLAKDIPLIVNYFLDSPDATLELGGFDLMKIPFEDELISELKHAMTTPIPEREKCFIVLEEGGKHYGHCHIERMENEVAYFYFFDWNGMLKRENVIDGLLTKAISFLSELYQLKTLYAETTPLDTYRNSALERAGFKYIEEQNHIRDVWSSEELYKVWKLDV